MQKILMLTSGSLRRIREASSDGLHQAVGGQK
jgi:hypothetical protein